MPRFLSALAAIKIYFRQHSFRTDLPVFLVVVELSERLSVLLCCPLEESAPIKSHNYIFHGHWLREPFRVQPTRLWKSLDLESAVKLRYFYNYNMFYRLFIVISFDIPVCFEIKVSLRICQGEYGQTVFCNAASRAIDRLINNPPSRYKHKIIKYTKEITNIVYRSPMLQ